LNAGWFEALVELGGDIVAILDAKGHFLFVNQAVQAALGVSPDALLNTHISELLHAEDLGTAQLAFEGDPGAPSHDSPVTLRMRDTQGNYRIFQVTAKRLLDQPPFHGILIHAHDVTILARSLEQARSVEAHLHELFENAAEMIACMDQEGRITCANAAWNRALGAEESEAKRSCLFELSVPEGRASLKETFSQLLQGRDGGTIRATLLGRSGEQVEVEGSAKCRRSWNTEAEIQMICRDVTTRNKLQQEREARQVLCSAILQSTNYIIVSTDPQGTIVTFNRTAEEMLGYAAEELIGKATPAIFHDPQEIQKRAENSARNWARPSSREDGYSPPRPKRRERRTARNGAWSARTALAFRRSFSAAECTRRTAGSSAS